jgi:hypothetical protein
MDSDYISDDTLSTQMIKIPNLNDLIERRQEMTINFNEVILNNYYMTTNLLGVATVNR